MRYIKYKGDNGFQTYGFVKDNSHKLDKWRMRFGRFSSLRNIKIYSYKMNIDLVVSAGEYLYIDKSEDYATKFKISKRNPFFLLLYCEYKLWVKSFKSKRYKNQVEYYLNND